MIKAGTDRSGKWGLKPRILASIIPIFMVTSLIAVSFNYLMAKENDEKRIEDYILQRRKDLLFLTSLPSLHMYLMNLKLGLEEEAAFVREGVQLYNLKYLKNQRPSFPHALSVVSLRGEELLRIENGEIKPVRQDFSTSSYLARLKASRYGENPPLPVLFDQVFEGSRIVDVFPVYSELNNRVIGGMIYEYRIPLRQLTQHSQKVLVFNILLSVLSMGVALTMVYFILVIIITPLKHLTEAAQQMLAGDLSGEIKLEGHGETKTLAATFEALRQRLENRIRELRDNTTRLEAIIDFLPDATIIIDKDKKVIFWNKAIEEMTGYSREAMIGKEYMEYAVPFYGEKRPILIDFAFESFQNFTGKYLKLQQKENAIKGTAWCSLVKGQRRLMAATASVLHDDDGDISGAIESIRDITENYAMEQEKNQLQAQLLHAQKMEAIGTLAGGIAHDFNNLIHAIQGYTEILLLDHVATDADYEKLKAIEKAAWRAGELTKQLLIFSRKAESKLRPVNLNREVKSIYSLLQRTIPKMIAIELHLAEDLKMVNADSLQLEQVIMNLAINARDVMPEGGRLVVETANVHLDEKFSALHPGAKAGDYVVLTIADTGRGMDSQTLEHIFEPFFTTKEIGKGTGLGLAMVYGIINNHGGFITCSSEVGRGTAFKICLPIAADVCEIAEPETSAAAAFRGGNETILLVDDDESLRALGKDLLTKFGYTVIVAVDGENALELYRRQPVDLIVLDMIMPGMGGKRCLEELLKINSRVKVIIASGYADDPSLAEIMGHHAVSFIGKPYYAREMLERVREILGRD